MTCTCKIACKPRTAQDCKYGDEIFCAYVLLKGILYLTLSLLTIGDLPVVLECRLTYEVPTCVAV